MKRCLVLFLVAASALPTALAQSFCASDGQPRPIALLERFINADCETCWSNPATPKPARGEIALDWIVPGSKGEDAPLSAAANRDGLLRLESLGVQPPQEADVRTQRVQRTGKASLRVSLGMPFNDYIAASIALKPAIAGAQTAWLALVETIPAGTEGTPVERNLMRNLLMVEWDAQLKAGKPAPRRLYESRPMAIAAGAKPERLRVVGWVQDAQGRITSMAQSFCTGAR